MDPAWIVTAMLRPPGSSGRPRAGLRLARPVRRLMRDAVTLGLVLVLVGIAVHVAHHASNLGQSSECPVLAAAQQCPWTPAETPDVWIALAVAVALAAVVAGPSRSARFPRVDRGRAPPALLP
jgi:hypothetical protein